LDGISRMEMARIGGMDRQMRGWAHRINAEGPDGLKDIRSKGHPPHLKPDQLAALAMIVERPGGIPAMDGVVRYRQAAQSSRRFGPEKVRGTFL
jgi:transposase